MARQPAGSPVQRALLEEFEYEAMETCATDGSCQLACPVGIDTGLFIKEMRRRRHTERAEKLALATAKRWGTVEGASRAGLRLGPLAHRTKRGKALPPPAPRKLPPTMHPGAAAVYVPSCTNRIFGSERSWVVEALVEVSARAGLPVWIPEDVLGSCCGLPWGSKGFGEAHRHKANEMVERLWRWSGEGALPIVVDAASCTGSIADPGAGVLSEENAERLGQLEILDSVAWAHDRLLPWLGVSEKVGSATVHPTCAGRQLGLAPRLRALAGALADDVHIAPSATCCGFAGDRGISHPELTAAATRPQAEELAGRRFDAHLSNNRTCEIGLERATGEPYESVILLLERLTRSA
jgi:D-lactate dehydrogenase